MDTKNRAPGGTEAITKALDRIVNTTGAETDPVIVTASHRVLAASEWDTSGHGSSQTERERRTGETDR